jgi:3-hydroxypropanoate dehydrogenase
VTQDTGDLGIVEPSITVVPDMTDTVKISSDAQDLLFREARTPNTFSDQPVTDEQIAAIYELVKYAPTAMNTQPLRIVLVRQDETRERLLKHMAEGNREKTASAPLVAVLAADTGFHQHLDRTFPHFAGAKDLFADDAGREAAARFNATLQVGYFLLGVRAVGLAAGPMGGFDAEGIDNDLLAGTDLKSLLVVNIGAPGENPWYPRLPRLEQDEVVLEA